MNAKYNFFFGILTAGILSTAQAEKIQLDQLPEAVRQKVQSHAGGNRIEDIDREMRGKELVYEVAFKENGQHREVLFNRNGELLNADLTLKSPPSTIGQAQPGGNLSPMPVSLAASQKVRWADIPEAPRMTAWKALKGSPVREVERGSWNGTNVYEVAFNENGRHYEMQVAENGQMLHDPRAAIGNFSAAGSSPYSQITNSVHLAAGEKIETSKLPEPVNQALKSLAGGNRIEDVEKGTWNGKTIYEAAFKDNGRHIELQLDEKGQVVFDPRKSVSK